MGKQGYWEVENASNGSLTEAEKIFDILGRDFIFSKDFFVGDIPENGVMFEFENEGKNDKMFGFAVFGEGVIYYAYQNENEQSIISNAEFDGKKLPDEIIQILEKYVARI